jgi:transposase InsO family protein
MTGGRHRINHGGHRQLNAAIYRTVIVRMRFHQPTINYVARRTAEGKTKREIIRCLKRYVIREVYHLLRPAPRRAPRQVDNYRSVNPMAEALNGTCKAELIEMQGPWKDVDQVERVIFQWVTWYNEERLHSAFDYVPPAEYERDFWQGQERVPQSA